MSDPDAPYVPAAVPPDPARDARVAARRAAEARRAGAALDRLFQGWCGRADVPADPASAAAAADFVEALADAVASRLHHNRHYGVPDAGDPCTATASDVDDGFLQCVHPSGHLGGHRYERVMP